MNCLSIFTLVLAFPNIYVFCYLICGLVFPYEQDSPEDCEWDSEDLEPPEDPPEDAHEDSMAGLSNAEYAHQKGRQGTRVCSLRLTLYLIGYLNKGKMHKQCFHCVAFIEGFWSGFLLARMHSICPPCLLGISGAAAAPIAPAKAPPPYECVECIACEPPVFQCLYMIHLHTSDFFLGHRVL